MEYYAAPIWRRHDNATSIDDVARFAGVSATAEAAKAFLADAPARVLCLTCGAAGVWYRVRDGAWQHQSAPSIKVHDATGAGDAFWAGFLTAWMQASNLECCVKLGIKTAAMHLQGHL